MVSLLIILYICMLFVNTFQATHELPRRTHIGQSYGHTIGDAEPFSALICGTASDAFAIKLPFGLRFTGKKSQQTQQHL